MVIDTRSSGSSSGKAVAASLSLALALSMFASGPVSAAYKKSVTGHCQVWAPSMLEQDDYPVRYSGACADGRAEGKGRAEWLYRYADNKVKAVWEGEFRNGVFVGEWAQKAKINGKVEAVSGDGYLIRVGKVKGADLIFVASSAQDGPLDMCLPKELILEANPSLVVADDEQVKAVMEEGFQVFKALCVNRQKRSFQVSVYSVDVPFKLIANGSFSEPAVKALYAVAGGADTWFYYTNKTAEKARQQKRQQDFQAAKSKAREKFDAYSRQHQIAAWVTPQQLDENPFRWEGKTIGTCVRMEKMLTRDTALVSSADSRQGYGNVQLRGVTPDFPDRNTSVLVVAKVGAREAVAGASSAEGQYTTLTSVDVQPSKQADCGDWLGWQSGDDWLEWGTPYAPTTPTPRAAQ